MSVNKTPGGQMNRDRYSELKRILEERRREIVSEVHEKIRDVRTEGANSPTHGVLGFQCLRASAFDPFAPLHLATTCPVSTRGSPAGSA